MLKAKRTPTLRQTKLVKLIRSGMDTRQAMVKAGYTEKLAKQQIMSKNTREMVHKARESFVSQYIQETGAVKFNARFTVRRLFNIAKRNKSEKDRFNSVQAIKEHHRIVMGKESDSSSIQPAFVFIIPMTNQKDGWNGKTGAIDAEVVEPTKETPEARDVHGTDEAPIDGEATV